MNRRTMFGVAAGLMATLVAGGAIVAGAHAGRAGVMRRFVSAWIDDALDQAQVTPVQRTAIYEARDRAFAAVEAHRKDRTAHMQEALALFESDELDAGRVQGFVRQREQEHRMVADAISQALLDVHNTLTPAQRKAVADYVRAHAGRHMD